MPVEKPPPPPGLPSLEQRIAAIQLAARSHRSTSASSSASPSTSNMCSMRGNAIKRSTTIGEKALKNDHNEKKKLYRLPSNAKPAMVMPADTHMEARISGITAPIPDTISMKPSSSTIGYYYLSPPSSPDSLDDKKRDGVQGKSVSEEIKNTSRDENKKQIVMNLIPKPPLSDETRSPVGSNDREKDHGMPYYKYDIEKTHDGNNGNTSSARKTVLERVWKKSRRPRFLRGPGQANKTATTYPRIESPASLKTKAKTKYPLCSYAPQRVKKHSRETYPLKPTVGHCTKETKKEKACGDEREDSAMTLKLPASPPSVHRFQYDLEHADEKPMN